MILGMTSSSSSSICQRLHFEDINFNFLLLQWKERKTIGHYFSCAEYVAPSSSGSCSPGMLHLTNPLLISAQPAMQSGKKAAAKRAVGRIF
jgi:hypothetical protein